MRVHREDEKSGQQFAQELLSYGDAGGKARKLQLTPLRGVR